MRLQSVLRMVWKVLSAGSCELSSFGADGVCVCVCLGAAQASFFLKTAGQYSVLVPRPPG